MYERSECIGLLNTDNKLNLDTWTAIKIELHLFPYHVPVLPCVQVSITSHTHHVSLRTVSDVLYLLQILIRLSVT